MLHNKVYTIFPSFFSERLRQMSFWKLYSSRKRNQQMLEILEVNPPEISNNYSVVYPTLINLISTS